MALRQQVGSSDVAAVGSAGAFDAGGSGTCLPGWLRLELVGDGRVSDRGRGWRRFVLAGLQVQAAADQPPRAFSHARWRREAACGVYTVRLARRDLRTDP